MHIAFYSLLRNSSWGGSENLWYKTALLALENNHRVLIVVHQNLNKASQILNLESRGAEILFVQEVLTQIYHRTVNKLFSGFSQKYLTGTTIKKIKEFKPNVLLINQPGGYDILYNATASKLVTDGYFKCQILTHSYSIYDILSEEHKSALSHTFLKANRLYFVANKQANYILNYLNINFKNKKVVSNPLNLQKREIVAYPNENRKIIKMAMVTTLFFASKGIDGLVKILAKPAFYDMDWALEIYGSGPDQAVLEQLIFDFKLSKKIKIMGFSNNIDAIWAKNEILLMPSRVDAAPSVLLEAMACGRTAVCTNVGFCDEWIEHNINGFISSTVNHKDFELALLYALTQREKWKEMGIKCHQIVQNNHPSQPEKLFLNSLLNSE